MGLFSNCNGLLPALTSELQNGKSLLGTMDAPTLSLDWYRGSEEINKRCPWGEKTSRDSNPYTDYPDTGVVRTYDWNITRAVIAPDGYEKHVILVNGQFPGPTVEANWGDWIQVTVHNNIDDVDEGTAIHWHGFKQEGTPYMDGTPGVSQCPIAPEKSFTYKFQASVYGTTWYHSHYSSQWSGGLFGPFVVYGPNHVEYDIDLGPITFTDWWHKEYFTVVEEIMAPGFRGAPQSDNNLIQGKMNFNCSSAAAANDTTPCTDNAGLAKFKFQSGKTHRLRLINTGSQGTERISIDGHNMTVIANDFVEIEPYETQVVTLGTGQRVDVLVTADKGSPTSAFWMRANLTSCSGAQQPFARAVIYYEDADVNAVPDSRAWDVPDPGTCANDDLSLTKPIYKIELPEPSWTGHMDIHTFVNASDNFLWTFGGVAARVNYNDPTLLRAKEGNTTFTVEENVLDFTGNTSVRFIVENPEAAPHPMHMHGLNMYVISAGPGPYDGSTVVMAENPMRRDVQMVQPGGHIVVQMDTHNAGIWPFHCHISWHASAGFFSQMLFDADAIAEMEIPQSVYDGCDEWHEYTSRAIPNQIDSGL